MQDYVRYSSTKLHQNFQNREDLIRPVAKLFFQEDYQSVTLVASGSSYNSMLMVQDALQYFFHFPVYLYTPEHVLEYGLTGCGKTMLFVISQSGSSTNIINCLKYLEKEKIPSVSLTGNVDSQMAKYSYKIFDYGPGNEYVDFVTTGVQTLIEYFILLGCEISHLNQEQKDNFYTHLEETISYQNELLDKAEKYISKNHFSFAMESPTFFCGNGPNYGVAKEGALKFQETLKRPSMYYELEEFLHGPNMQLTPNYTVFLLDDSKSNKNSRFNEVFEGLKEVTPNVFFITDSENKVDDDYRVFKARQNEDWILSPYYSLPVIQLIAAKMSDELGTWDTHPYFTKFEKNIEIKTSDYDQEIDQIRRKWEAENNK
ncbi:SIS domain-containing protein [Lactobacillus apis]|uniref:SIS domain-containing protein n=1 Tax=Lactobacillus apis TaxID=303541 RepID=UPI0008159BE5|nr:SIS domain-containing protein [Lactobacillus apis]SCC05397.1 SIS domain-containing protein [Lactobacillus apis]